MDQTVLLIQLLSVTMFLVTGSVTGKTQTDVDRLVKDLKSNYSIYARPPINQSQVLTVEVSYTLNAIKEFDEVKDKFSVTGTVIMAWQDDRLQWKPEEYGGVDHILVNNDVFWTPPLYLQNSIDETKKIGEDPYWKVRFQSPGFAVFYPGASLSAVCTAMVFNFPWDEQFCYLAFTLIGYLADEIKLKPFSNGILDPLQHFYGNGLWDVERSRVYIVDSTIVFGFFMRRKPLLALVNIILPVLLMSFLNIMVFLIPAESGERISFCLTVLLAIAVFLTLVSDSMPKSATSIAFLSYYLVAVLSLSIFITIGTIINLKIYHKDDDTDVPHWLQKVSRRLLYRKKHGRTKASLKYRNGITKNTDRAFIPNSDNYSRNFDQRKGPHKEPVRTHDFDLSLDSHQQKDDTIGKVGVFTVPQHTIRPEWNGRQNESAITGELKSPNRTFDEHSIDNRRSHDSLKWKEASFAVDMVFFTACCLFIFAMTLTFFIIATKTMAPEATFSTPY